MRHDLERLSGRCWRCRRCGAEYSRRSRSGCPEKPLYRGRANLPAGLLTRTELRAAHLRLSKDARCVGWLETAYHRRYRVYGRDQATPLPPRSPAQMAAWERARTRRHTCARCGLAVGGEGLIRGPDYHHHCAAIPESRVCADCYAQTWYAGERARIAAHKDRLRAALEHAAVIDFETVGLDAPAAIEVAVWHKGGLLFESRIHPGAVPWDGAAYLVHKIRPSDVADAPTWETVEVELLRQLAEAQIEKLYSWTFFDKRVVSFERRRAGRSDESWSYAWGDLQKVHDQILWVYRPMTRSKAARYGQWTPRSSLKDACTGLGVPPGCHRAAADVRATWGVLEAMLARPLQIPFHAEV